MPADQAPGGGPHRGSPPAAGTTHQAGPVNALLQSWDRTEEFLIGLLAAYGLFAAMYQTLTRYAFPELAGEWSEETMVYALIWAVFLAASSLAGQDGHVRADMLLRMVGEPARRGIEVFNTVVALTVTLFLTYYGIQIAWEGYLWDERSMTTLRFPMWLYFASVPVGAGLMVLRYVRRLYVLLFTSAPAVRFDHHDPVNVD